MDDVKKIKVFNLLNQFKNIIYWRITMSSQDLKFKMFEVHPDQDRDQLDSECANLELDLIAKNLDK